MPTESVVLSEIVFSRHSKVIPSTLAQKFFLNPDGHIQLRPTGIDKNNASHRDLIYKSDTFRVFEYGDSLRSDLLSQTLFQVDPVLQVREKLTMDKSTMVIEYAHELREKDLLELQHLENQGLEFKAAELLKKISTMTVHSADRAWVVPLSCQEIARPHASQQDAATRKYWKIELEISLPTRVEEDPTFEEKVIQFLKEKKGDLTQTVVVCMADATGQMIRKWEVTIDYRDVDLS